MQLLLNKCFGCVIALFLLISSAFAGEGSNSNQLLEYLLREKNNLTQAIARGEPLTSPSSHADFLQRKQQNEAMIALNRAKMASFESFLSNQKKLQADFSSRIKQLQQFPSANSSQTQADLKLERIGTLTDINKKTIELINEDIALSHHYHDLLTEENKALWLQKYRTDMQNRITFLKNQEKGLHHSLKKLLANSLRLQQEIKEQAPFKSNYTLEARILLNNQLINLSQYKLAELNLQKNLAKSDFSLLKNPDIRTLENVTEVYKSTISQLSDMEQSLKKMVLLLKNEQPHIKEPKLQQQFSALIKVIHLRVSGIAIQEQTLQEDLENHEKELKKQISVRKHLSEYRFNVWPTIFQQVCQIPLQAYHYLKSLTLKTWANYLWHDFMQSLSLWLMLLFSATALFGIKAFLKRVIQDKERSRLSAHLYDGILVILSRNMLPLTLLTTLWVLFYGNQVPYAYYQLLFHLIFVWLLFRVMLIVARLGLMERVSDASGKDVYLYYRIKWLLLFGAWISLLMVFSHELPLSLLLQDIFNRLFMLFLVSVSFVYWLSRDMIRHLLHPLLQSKKLYLRNAMILILVLTPLTLCTTALIGLVGYINLAWTMSRYQVQIVVIIAAYVIIRGLLFEALELISEWMIGSLKNGWLWIEVFLKPMDKIARAFLLLSSLFILASLFESPSEPTLLKTLLQIGEYHLVNNAGVHITGKSLVNFLTALCIFIWIAKWTREFCFRWVYRNTTDAGIRNSLSVFTQYALILVGGYLTLWILGFDFTGMSMILGGLAVGMGFGLRDFASNVVGGLMLLIERPVREGDLITLGAYEGKVAHIGIRSMRVSSWDNMEVLIPNAETFNKPFTNWTHQDGIVRTVIPIKVSREDDPILIQQLILDVLAIIPEIVAEPPTQVLLIQISEALIEFEVRYFINVQLHTRFEIRSKVLFAIMAQFKASGIRPPIPPINVTVEEERLLT